MRSSKQRLVKLMARTYEYNPSNISECTKDRMRFELGDTMVEGGSDTSALCDEEYNAVIQRFPRSWKRAKLHCLESICRRFAYEPDTSTGPLSFAFSARAKLWREDYEKLKQEIGDDVTVVPPYGRGPDGRKKPPYFHADMMENWEKKIDEKHHVPSPR